MFPAEMSAVRTSAPAPPAGWTCALLGQLHRRNLGGWKRAELPMFPG